MTFNLSLVAPSLKMPRFNRVVIVGLGLIGGSLGLAIKRRRLAREVVGVSRKEATLRQARRCHAIDRGTRVLAEAVHGSDLVVIATPVAQIVPIAQRVARMAAHGTIITDVGSAKSAIVRALDVTLPPHVHFVGAHPLAGSERRGMAAAATDLFEHSLCVLTPTRRTHRPAVRRVRALWQSLDTRVVLMSPNDHDAAVAAISHVPHVLAFALMQSTPATSLPLASRSFLDATRVAASDPQLWQEIFLMNRRPLLTSLQRVERELRRLRRVLGHGDAPALTRWIRVAQQRRLAWNAFH